MKYFKKIEGEKVYLSPMCVEDAEDFARWLNDPEISQFLSYHSCMITKESEKEFVEKALQEEFHLCIVNQENDQLIGNIALTKLDYKNGSAELGILIGQKKNHSKGYGSEAIKLLTNYAFQELRLHTIYLRTLDNNPRAIRAYEKCGFKESGRRHEAVYRHGKYIDVIYMELINK